MPVYALIACPTPENALPAHRTLYSPVRLACLFTPLRLFAELIKTGLLVKQGAVRKSWKERWFVVKNAADNYLVEYFKSEADWKAKPDKPKGCVRCCIVFALLQRGFMF